jgi:hypothetical protein
MNYTYPTHKPVQVSSLATEQSRQRLVSAVISFTQGTSIFIEPYEKQLLDQFVRGRMTIDEVVYYLETSAIRKG